jgi:hypothetical protein
MAMAGTKEVRFKPGEYEWWPGGRLGGENLETSIAKFW